jgi:hypothetical protein
MMFHHHSRDDFFYGSFSRTKSGRMNESIDRGYRDVMFWSFHETNVWIHHPMTTVPISHLSTCCCSFRIQTVKENNGSLLHLALFDSRYLSTLHSTTIKDLLRCAILLLSGIPYISSYFLLAFSNTCTKRPQKQGSL